MTGSRVDGAPKAAPGVDGRADVQAIESTRRLTTERLALVPLRPDDATEMHDVLADPALYAFIGGAPPTPDELRARYARWAEGSPRPGEAWHNWVIRLRAGGEAIGHVQATIVDVGRTADIAWLVGTPWQGQGYASEAARTLVQWLESGDVKRITAHVRADHAASGRVAAAAGLSPTDEIEDGEVVWRRSPNRERDDA